ncbi:benzoate/H(+) symporter BenE family transporter [Salinarimonas soli]|uniref:Benzoate/H(+) symporter BenE family transporter n=1 Tax=Salinarimonas soli TaxID=1638099 RepID=A0A5B2VER0_9HYPH|nr:benzoate/H(+) symporter BenE family transporter [Salinarimonas soli]KAA2236677.1 benzoate/H(+) symporter BenE family transporter [Salinarimonas soli]
MRVSVAASGLVAALVGFAGTLAIIVAAARAVGATPEETSSWVAGLCLAIAGTTGYLSLRHRLPIVTAWSTPGAALVAASTGIGIGQAVGAFLLAAALVLLTAAVPAVARLIERLPTAVAAGMLAGILVRFVIGVFESAGTAPELVLPLVATFLVARLVSPAGAVLAVIAVGLGLAGTLGRIGPLPSPGLSTLNLVTPVFDPAVLAGLGLPLFIVTMASQNLPGFAVLRANGYPVPARSILAVTGLASLVTAPFGVLTSNLAAITAAICAGPDAHPDPARRWLTGPVLAAAYVGLAAFGASLVGVFAALPVELVRTVAGLALAGALAGALGSALAVERDRFAAVLTLTVTASGLALGGIGSAFWGLLAGLAVIGSESAARAWRGRAAGRP